MSNFAQETQRDETVAEPGGLVCASCTNTPYAFIHHGVSEMLKLTLWHRNFLLNFSTPVFKM